MSTYQLTKSGQPVLLGKQDFERSPLFGLEVGEQIIAIGCPAKSGKQTSSCRILEFDYPVKYSGIFRIDEDGEERVYAAFQFDSRSIKNWSLFLPEQPCYGLWAFIEEERELILQNFKSLSIGIYKAVFTRPAH